MAENLEIIITASDQASRVLGGVGDAAGKLGGALGGALKIGLAGAAAGLTGLGAGIAFSVKGAMEAEGIQAQLAQVLKSTGGAAGVTADAANELANSLSGLTPFEDDAILGAENMLLTFTSIGKEVFPDATETVLDMSQALGQDLKSSSIQLGKALNNPIEGVTALQRVGVRFTEAQKAQIETLVNSGRTMDAQKLILKELQTEFGGSAKAAGQTFGGQLTILRNTIGNLSETIGAAFLPALTDLIGWINKNVLPVFKIWADEAVPKITAAFKDMGAMIGTIAGMIQKNDWNGLAAMFWGWVETARAALAEKLGQLVGAIGQYFAANWEPTIKPKLLEWASKIWAWVGDALGMVGIKLGELINAIGVWMQDANTKAQLGEFGKMVGRAIADGIGALFRASDDPTMKSVGSSIVSGLWEVVKSLPVALGEIGAGIAVGVVNGFAANFGLQLDKSLEEWFMKRAKYAAPSGWMALLPHIGDREWFDQEFGGRASGGPVSANTPYIVGERGPELFVPNSGGTIIPNGVRGNMTFQFNIQSANFSTPQAAEREANNFAFLLRARQAGQMLTTG